MNFKFSAKITFICGILALLMFYASYWQYERYLQKLEYIRELDDRLAMPVTELSELLRTESDWKKLIHRRVSVSGLWDYEHEVVLRNRKYENSAGVHVITPLTVQQIPDKKILVSRGFIPLSKSEKQSRTIFQNGPSVQFAALIKESVPRKIFAPKDPQAGPGLPWVDAWLRVDIENISKQLPFPVQPFYLEMIARDSVNIDSSRLVQQKSERDEILFMPGAASRLSSIADENNEKNYPVPVFDTIVPAGRHFSYIFEWAIMAMMVIVAGIILQLRRNS